MNRGIKMENYGYKEISDDIREKIQSGYYHAGDYLPKQFDLAKQYRTSRITIQKALRVLSMEGFLLSKKGVGTCVKDTGVLYSDYMLHHSKDFDMHLISAADNKVTSQIISFDSRPLDEDEAVKLMLKSNELVYDITRLRYVNQEPLRLEYLLIPQKYFPELQMDDLEDSLYEYIYIQTKQKLSKSLLKITADFPDFYDQKYLYVNEHQVVLRIEQTTYFNSGIPCFLAEIRYSSENGQIISVYQFDEE